MECKCPTCQSTLVKKNGHIHNGKQNYRCISCGRQFVLEPTQRIINEKTRNQVRRALLERVSLPGSPTSNLSFEFVSLSLRDLFARLTSLFLKNRAFGYDFRKTDVNLIENLSLS